MTLTLIRRLLWPIVELREDEGVTALLMFAYAFLAMASYNIIQPLTRSKLIDSLGAVNIPYVVLAQGLVIGGLMLGYGRLYSALPRRWALPLIQSGMAVAMIGFWWLFRTNQAWVSVLFYMWGAILGVLLTSQFWTLANGIYDPRQAKRLFGFVGGGIMLGGMTGAGLTALIIEAVGLNALLLGSALALGLCAPLVSLIISREQSVTSGVGSGGVKERPVTIKRAFELLGQSKQVQLVALVITFGSLGAALVDQQVNMAAETLGAVNSIGKFLAQIRFTLSMVAFVVQVWLTPLIHRYLGIGFALMILPTNLGATAAAILLVRNVWAPAGARIGDQALRYSVDKTTREVLFLPLPRELRQEAKPFVDVTVDRVARGLGAVFMLILIQPWGFHLRWHQLSYVSLGLTAVWYYMASRAKRQYLQAFRQSIERHDIEVADVSVDVGDSTTIETLVEELASTDERRVLYAIDLLDSLDKRNLITPLLLHHESSRVRVRALEAMTRVRPDLGERWLPSVERLLADADHDVRAAAARTLAALRHEHVVEIMRSYLDDADHRLVLAAASALADSALESDVAAGERALEALTRDSRTSAAHARRDVARALSAIRNPRFRHLLVPLFYDADVTVATEAIRSAGMIGAAEPLFIAPLVSLLRHRVLKGAAREVLVGYGDAIFDVMAHFVRDSDEDMWVRRHIPATLARIPSQKSMDLLVELLSDDDGFLRYKAMAAIETLRREHADLTFGRERIEAMAIKQAMRYLAYLSLDYNLRRADADASATLLGCALREKLERTKDRVYRLLGLLYSWRDIAAARWALTRGDSRARASAAEYLDTLLKGDLRKRAIPVLEDLPLEERVRRANVLVRSRPRDLEDTLVQLVHDEDQVVASAAIHYVEAKKLTALAGDLEYILAARDLRDWSVFEAASWALALQRMPVEERRARWLEPLPAVEVANRLRRVPLFMYVSADELFRIAASGRQLRYEPGQRLHEPGAPVETFQFLLDGRASCSGKEGTDCQVSAPAALVFDATLKGTAAPETITALEPAISLALSTDDFRALLADSVPLSQGLFRVLMSGTPATDWPLVLPALPSSDARRAPGGRLRPVEKVMTLQAVPLFARATADELLALASIAREDSIAVGSDLFKEGEPAAIYVIVNGRLQVTNADGDVAASGPGDTIGIVQTLGGGLSEARAHVVEAGLVLRIDREALFDLLGERVELLRALFSTVLQGASQGGTPARHEV